MEKGRQGEPAWRIVREGCDLVAGREHQHGGLAGGTQAREGRDLVGGGVGSVAGMADLGGGAWA